jgi:two-component system LytT family sensor kinase
VSVAVQQDQREDVSSVLSALLVVAAWTVPALLSTFETVTFARLSGHPIELWRAFVTEAPGWYTWALCTPVVARVAMRAPLVRPVRARNVLAHVVSFLLITLAASAVWALVSLWLRPTRGGFLVALRNWFFSGLPFTVIVYAAVVGIVYSLTDRARLRLRERDAARLAQQLSEAQLASLRMQLRPHFLFNSLNAIMALVRDAENSRAVAALGLLSDMLRTSLEAGARHEVSLGDEITFTRHYLEMEQLRFGDRLQVMFDVPPELLDAAVPQFVLQPFVENSIKHGILDRRRGGSIAISARLDGDALHLSVVDDGVGLGRASPSSRGSGVGLKNSRLHLAHLYGDRAAVRVGAGANGNGVAVEVTMPLRRVPTRADVGELAIR